MELLSIKNSSKEFKIELLKQLGYSADQREIYILKNGEPYLDKYIDKPVQIDNMTILPGSTIIIDDNPLSIASYMEEYGEVR